MTNPASPADHPVVPKDEDTQRIGKLHGADRGGLGAKGWAEVPEDRIGGHPELEEGEPPTAPNGDLNGRQPKLDRETGAAAGEDAND